MKNIILNQEQVKIIRESIVQQEKEERLSFLVGLNPSENISEETVRKFLKDGYEDAVSCFNDDITKYTVEEVTDKLSKLIAICQKKEENIKNELEKLCCDVVEALFDFKGKDITVECNLVQNITNDKNFHVESSDSEEFVYDSVEEKDKIKEEIRKRYIVDCLSYGASQKLSELVIKGCLTRLFELDEELPHLYNKVVKINNYLLYSLKEKPNKKDNLQGAYEEINVTRGSNEISIKAEGIIFPFLLSELIRAHIEILSCDVLPENDEVAEIIINKCDCLVYEPFYMTFGKSLLDYIIGEEKLDEEEIIALVDKLFNTDLEKFNDLMNEVLERTKLGNTWVEELIKEVKYENDYSSFTDDLKKKQAETNIIFGEYEEK